METLKIANAVTIEQLNPLNFALKNQYFSNLITTALLIVPTATAIAGDSVRVVTGFLSKAFVESTFDYSPRYKDILKHSKGLALEISFDDFVVDKAVKLSKEVMMNTDVLIKTLIDSEKKIISFYLDSDKSILLQSTLDGVRTIWSK